MKPELLSCLRLATLSSALLGTTLISAGAGGASGVKPLAGALQPFVDAHTLAGAVVLVANKDGVLDVEAVGYSDAANGRQMRTDTLFWIASQTKAVTAAALMMLVDAGKVHLDDPVTKYLPEFGDQWLAEEEDADHVLLKRPRTPVTVRHTLCHTSGMPFASALEQPTLDLLPLRDRVRSYSMTPLRSEPGTRFQYSNAGINTAGRIIEVVSGMPYEEFLARRLFAPLGMKDTTFWPNKRQIARLARCYKPNAAGTGIEETPIGQLRYPLDDRVRQAMPAGGLFATAADVARFCRMVLNGGTLDGHRYLSEAAVREMTKRQTAPHITESYGFGWFTDGVRFEHGGACGTNMRIDAERGLITIFLVQHAGFPGDGGESLGAFRRAAEQFGDGPR